MPLLSWVAQEARASLANTRTEFVLFRRAAALRNALPPKCGDDALDAVYRTPVVRVEQNAIHGRPLLMLYDQGVAQMLTRSSLRFVPFPFSVATSVFQHLETADPLMEWREMGQHGLLHSLVYTPALWALLRTEDHAPSDPDDLLRYDVVVPVHYLFRKYRTMLFIILSGDHAASLEAEMDADVEPEWMKERNDMDASYALFCARCKEERIAVAKQHMAELEQRRALLDDVPGSDAAYDELRAKKRKEVDAAPEEKRESLVHKLASWERSMESVRDEGWATVRAAHEERFEQWRKTNAELEASDYASRVPVERNDFPAMHAQAIKQRATHRRQQERRLEKQRRLQAQWELQLGQLFEKQSKLLKQQRVALRERYAQAKDEDEVVHLLHMYTVGVLNAIEMMLMTLMRIPVNLRTGLQTSMEEPRADLEPAGVSERRALWATTTAQKALEQRRTLDATGEMQPDWIFPPAMPGELLTACTGPDSYVAILRWALDNWRDNDGEGETKEGDAK